MILSAHFWERMWVERENIPVTTYNWIFSGKDIPVPTACGLWTAHGTVGWIQNFPSLHSWGQLEHSTASSWGEAFTGYKPHYKALGFRLWLLQTSPGKLQVRLNATLTARESHDGWAAFFKTAGSLLRSAPAQYHLGWVVVGEALAIISPHGQNIKIPGYLYLRWKVQRNETDQ